MTTSSRLRQAASRIQPLHSLELFAGPGGMALGVHLAGFQHLALIERDRFASETLRKNCDALLHIQPDRVLHRDAMDVDYQPYQGKVDLLAAGPPCQPFSTGGKAKGPNDPRNMFPLLLDIVPKVMPRAVLIENVKGITREKFRDYFDYIRLRLCFPLLAPQSDETWEGHFVRLVAVQENAFRDEEQYVVGYQVVNAANYGVPQCRERVLIHAFRRDLGLTPFQLDATHEKAALMRDQWATGSYWRRHNMSTDIALSHSDQARAAKMQTHLFDEQSLPWQTVRDAICDLPPAVPRGQQPTIPNHIQHPGARAYAGHTGSLMDSPAKALKAGAHGTPGGENMVQIPGTNGLRYFTTREAARLQTFPDTWCFDGTWGACIQQLGNAVPVRLAELFATEIRQRLDTLHRGNQLQSSGLSTQSETAESEPVVATGVW